MPDPIYITVTPEEIVQVDVTDSAPLNITITQPDPIDITVYPNVTVETIQSSTDTQRMIKYVRNNTGHTLEKGRYVYVTGGHASEALTVEYADNRYENSSSKTLGAVSADIPNNQYGYVVTQGFLTGFDTSSFTTEGARLYLGENGNFTDVEPETPDHMVFVGYLVKKGGVGVGSIYVSVQNGFEFHELHDVLITSPTNNQIIQYDQVTELWKNQDIVFPEVGLDDLKDVETSGIHTPTNGQVLNWVSSVNQWRPTTITHPFIPVNLTDLSDVNIISPNSGDVLSYNGVEWGTNALPFVPVDIDDLTDVDTSTIAPTLNDVLTWDGTNWTPLGAQAPRFIDDLDDVDTSSTAPSDGDVLTWDDLNSNWVPAAPTGGGGSFVPQSKAGQTTFVSNRVVWNGALNNATTITSRQVLSGMDNKMLLLPYVWEHTFDGASIECYVSTANSNTNFQFVIYESDAGGMPTGTTIYRSSTISGGSTGIKSGVFPSNITFTGGKQYWIGLIIDSPTSGCYIRGASSAYFTPILGPEWGVTIQTSYMRQNMDIANPDWNFTTNPWTQSNLETYYDSITFLIGIRTA